MKKILLIYAFLPLISFSQVKIAKIIKVENQVAKDEWGNVKDNFKKFKLTLDNGQTHITEHTIDDVNLYGIREIWTYQGLNKSKNMYIWTIDCLNCSIKHFRVMAVEFRLNNKTKKYKAYQIEYHPDLSNFEGTSSLDGSFWKDYGWSFNRLDNDRIILTKQGVEYKLKTAQKTDGTRYFVFE